MKYVLFLSLLSISLSSVAQSDSIRSEILKYESSNFEIISKGRRMMIDKLQEEDFQKMAEVKSYLKTEMGKQGLVAFTSMEYWLILYWTQEFEELLLDVENIGYQKDAPRKVQRGGYTGVFRDGLLAKLKEKSHGQKHILDIIIDNAKLQREHKDFLKLHLNYCLSGYVVDTIDQELLNKQSDRFILNYPSSTYVPFVKKVIRYKEDISDFGWGWDLYFGYGTFNGGISQTFSDHFTFGMSINMEYKNVVLDASFSLASSVLKKDVLYNNIVWDKDRNADVFIPSATIGYTFFGKRQINITPFAGVSSLYIAPSYEDMQSYSPFEEIEFNSGPSWNTGVSINFSSRAFSSPSYTRRVSKYKMTMKLKYNYLQSGFGKDSYGLDGSLHQVTLGFGGFVRRVRRSY